MTDLTAAPCAVVVLVGAPGAGKTRTGKRVARILGLPFIDTDRVISRDHGPIPAIFEQFGEPYFRALERDAVAASLRERAVVSLGGGAVLSQRTRDDLAGLPVVQLTTSVEAIASRIGDGRRPLLKDGTAAWEALVATRQPIYDAVAALTIDTSRSSIDAVASRVADWVRSRPESA